MPPLFTADLDHVLAYTRHLWEEARGGRFFITGGTGFFGIWMLESFCHINDALDLGMQAVVLTRDPDHFVDNCPHLGARNDLRFVTGDVRTFDFPTEDFHYLIHAGTKARSTVPPLEMFDTITAGTRRALDFAVACHARKFLFISSGAVYGIQPPEITHVPETYPGAPDPANPNSAYGEGKRAAELLCSIYHQQYGFETKIARCFAFVGPHLPLDAHFAIGNFILDALRGGPIRVNGDGTPLRSCLYAADLAIWLWTILFRGQSGRAYNVGSDKSFSVSDIAQVVADLFSPHSTVQIAEAAEVGRPPKRYVPAIGRIQSELGINVEIPLSEATLRTIQWYSGSKVIPDVHHHALTCLTEDRR